MELQNNMLSPLNALSNSDDADKGASLVGYKGANLKEHLDKTVVSFETLANAKTNEALTVGQTIFIGERDSHYVVANSGAVTSPETDNIALFGGRVAMLKTDKVSSKQFGLVGDGATDDNDAISQALKKDGTLALSSGTYLLDKEKVFSSIKPINVKGNGHATYIHVGDNNADNTAFRLEAIGASFGPNREMSQFENLNFTGVGKTAIDCQAVFPIILKSVRCENMGGAAIKYHQCYYGRMSDVYLTDSGLNFNNVNNMAISGGDISGVADSENYVPTDYACNLEDVDRITFDDLTFESWRNRVLRVTEAKSLQFRDVWFEANTADHIIKLESCSDVHFRGGYIEAYPSPTNEFILIDNSAVIGVDRVLKTLITLKGGYLRLNNSTSSNFKFVNIENKGAALLSIDGVAIRNGYLIVHKDVIVNAKNILLGTTTGAIDEVKFLESEPNAIIKGLYNSWVEKTKNSDWDFALGANFSEVGGSTLSIATTVDENEVLSGTRAIKTVIPADSTEYTIQRNMSEMGAISTEGETHLIFVRLKTSQSIDVQFAVEGQFLEYQVSPIFSSKSDRWTDYVLKTASDVTWAQGRQGNPKIKIKMTNDSGELVDVLLDRIDYATVHGDVVLP